ncbi:Abhydrolase domain-containing protein 2-A [Aphelenchoides besseyi]|nr:Abhydrolase domain-containing protein 2-A [Aphelenchoides besseyi]KAI6218938.1 Abhydrolase domain-containing protein 2-A [Aphelenchoides besseyi]
MENGWKGTLSWTVDHSFEMFPTDYDLGIGTFSMETIHFDASVLADYLTPNVACCILILLPIFRFLNVFSYTEPPTVTLNPSAKHKDDGKILLKEVLSNCPILYRKYNPPTLYGRNGHIMTAIYGMLSHSSLSKYKCDKRHAVILEDGATITFDVFEPTNERLNGDYTIALAPGICNWSSSNYIKTLVSYARRHGFRCVCLNHLGADPTVPLTAPRIFSYGSTEELSAMYQKMMELYPQTKFISVGFSMGANLTTLYLSSVPPELQSRFLFGLSVCQGYNAANIPHFHSWSGGKRVYSMVIAENVKRVLRRHYDTAVLPHVRSGLVDERRLFAATSMIGIDEHYNRRVQGFKSLGELYYASSSIHTITDIEIPTIFLNSADDPIIPENCYRPVEELCGGHERHAFIRLKHGGHLGFLEGWSLKPNSCTWLDRFVVELANAAVASYESSLVNKN